MSLFSAVEPKQHKVCQDSKTNADLGAGSLSRVNKVDSCFSISANKNTHGKFASVGEKHNRDKCNVKCPWKFQGEPLSWADKQSSATKKQKYSCSQKFKRILPVVAKTFLNILHLISWKSPLLAATTLNKTGHVFRLYLLNFN